VADNPIAPPAAISLVEGIDKKLYGLLVELYAPFLARSHLSDRYQYIIMGTINGRSCPIGCLSQGKSDFIQVAVVPGYRGSGAAEAALEAMVVIRQPLKRVGWTSHRANYPSLRLLQRLKGGIFERCARNKKRVNMEGFYRPSGTATKSMRVALESILPRARDDYSKWHGEIYTKRNRLMAEVSQYMANHIDENNSGCIGLSGGDHGK